MNERIKEIRKHFGLTQQEFADRLQIKRGAIANYEIGRNVPIDAVISLICREFNINENWLRTGNGEMKQELPPEDEVAAVISNVLEDIGCENSIYTLVKELLLKYEKLDSKSKKVIDEYADEVIKGYIQKREEF